MNYDILEKYITDFIQEQQLKIGYRKETLRVYYFLSSLNNYTMQQLSVSEMVNFLNGFCSYVSERLGNITVTHSGERFFFQVPENGVEYVHQLPLHNQFLPGLLEKVSTHGSTMEEIINTFKNTSYSICVKKIENGEFDYLIYFENHPNDSYRYCFKDEGAHITYHRFTKEDYEDIY